MRKMCLKNVTLKEQSETAGNPPLKLVQIDDGTGSGRYGDKLY